MRDVFGTRKRRDAQTLVFFLLAWGTIMLLCGLAIDSGLLYLAKARLGRAVDGAALAAIAAAAAYRRAAAELTAGRSLLRGALDVAGRDLCDGVIEQAGAAGATVLLSSHDPERTAKISNQVVQLAGGAVVAVSEGQRPTRVA